MKIRFLSKLNPFKSIHKFNKKMFILAKDRIQRSLRLQLLFIVGICLLSSILLTDISNSMLNSNSNHVSYIDYSSSMRNMEYDAQRLSEKLSSENINEDEIKDYLVNYLSSDYETAIITDIDGNILFSSRQNIGTKVDIHSIIKTAMGLRIENYQRNSAENDNYQRDIFYSIYPIIFSDTKAFIIVSGIPQGEIHYYSAGDGGIAFLTCILTFVLMFLYLTKKKIKYIEEISNGLIEISKGDLNYSINIRGNDELASLSKNINYMESELKNKIESERAAEKTKNELITNVSHDLRTPLTSIMGYIGLIRDGKCQSLEELNEYLNIAYNKSEKLKILIDDLFEYTKLANEGIKLNKTSIIINELLGQLIEELVPICEENNITIIKEIPREKITVFVDADKIIRVFENLITNAIKYSHKPGEVKVSLIIDDGFAVVCIKNKGDHISNTDLYNIFNRFYRVEKSRSSSTGGSGLGLAISKSIVDLHGGKIWAECQDEDISFYVKLKADL